MDSIKEIIEKAEKSVEDVQDPNLKKTAFEVILNKLLQDSSPTRNIASPPTPGSENKDLTSSINVNNLLSATELSLDEISSVVDIDEEGNFHIITDIPGNTVSSQQRNATLLVLTLHHFLFANREIRSRELNDELRDLGIGSLQNLAANLKGIQNLILAKSKKKGAGASYRITNPGINYGIDLIRDLVSSDGK